jgi:hypothetical protein
MSKEQKLTLAGWAIISGMGLFMSSCKTEPERPDDIEEPAAAEAAPAPPPSPDVGTGTSAAGGGSTDPGTRADYQPTTGQGGQEETEGTPQAPKPPVPAEETPEKPAPRLNTAPKDPQTPSEN